MVKKYGYQSILELGTSLGISCQYLGSACPDGQVVTIEGDPVVYDIAKKCGDKVGLSNIQYLQGEFDTHLNNLSELGAPYDLVLIDGNHSYEPTIKYFRLLWSVLNEKGAIIVDDIHWSSGMEYAWTKIKEQTEDAFCFETWRFGIVFKKVNAVNGQNVKWIPSYLKPWRAGLFK